ncbi:hypothetical protein A2U01_0099192, partial [Trifolium medium]|nr:hypothetical protein [Trifolium medium]
MVVGCETTVWWIGDDFRSSLLLPLAALGFEERKKIM